jgi:hypothetical protein
LFFYLQKIETLIYPKIKFILKRIIMVCYIIPLIATVIGLLRRKIKHPKDPHSYWLNLMFLGGAIFGVIDHLWNGELFLIGENLMTDLALGVTITSGIIVSWGVIISLPRINRAMGRLSNRLGILKQT